MTNKKHPWSGERLERRTAKQVYVETEWHIGPVPGQLAANGQLAKTFCGLPWPAKLGYTWANCTDCRRRMDREPEKFQAAADNFNQATIADRKPWELEEKRP